MRKIKRLLTIALAAVTLISAIPMQSDTVLAKTTLKTVTISTVNDTSVQKVVNKLNAGKAFYIKFTGNYSSAVKKYYNIQQEIGKSNKYGVSPFVGWEYIGFKNGEFYDLVDPTYEFDDWEIQLYKECSVDVGVDGKRLFVLDSNYLKKSGNGYRLKVTKKMISNYKYAIKFWKKNVDHAINNFSSKYLGCVDETYLTDKMAKYDTYEAFIADVNKEAEEAIGEENDEGEFVFATEEEALKWRLVAVNDYAGYEILKYYWNVIKNNFCDLSDAMKVWVLSESGYFDDGKLYGMYYTKDKTKQRNWDTMAGLNSDYVAGQCYHYAKAEQLALRQIGIFAKYCSSEIHAWTEMDVKNSDGEEIHIRFDYGIATDLTKIY